jgi:hypothetical protein
MDVASHRLLLRLLPVVLPLAVRCAERREATILEAGEPLAGNEFDAAVLMGVRYPEKIRILNVESIPMPKMPMLNLAARLTGLMSGDTAGMALRYGIYVRRAYSGNIHLIAHECVHTAQYERLGGFTPFLRQYLAECLEVGYLNSPLEREAISRSDIFAS